MAKAWIENADDIDQNILSIDVYQDQILQRSINWIYRPLTWHIELEDNFNE